LIHNLGNLVLSQNDFNSAYGNRGYNVKRKRYLSNADLLRVKEIANTYSEWRNINLIERQKKMIHYAVIDDGSGNGRWKLDCESDIAPESEFYSVDEQTISQSIVEEVEDAIVRNENLSETTWSPPENHSLYNFAPSVNNMNSLVFGSNRPGYKKFKEEMVPLEISNDWIDYMRQNEITRVICLLNDEQKKFYDYENGSSLISLYEGQFSDVINPEVADYTPPTEDQIFNEIIPFLEAGEEKGEKTLIHCSMGRGRTGFVLHAWNCYKGYAKSDDRNYLLGTRDPWESGSLDVCNKIFKKCEELSNEEE
jgi:protein-tyrosine phosphatase